MENRLVKRSGDISGKFFLIVRNHGCQVFYLTGNHLYFVSFLKYWPQFVNFSQPVCIVYRIESLQIGLTHTHPPLM